MDDETAWLPPELAPVALRLARADQVEFQIGELALEWSRGALQFEQVETDEAALELTVTGILPIPPLLSMLFSEAIHHLRAAVENTLFYLVKAARGGELSATQVRAIEMPIYEDPKDLAKWQKDRKRRGVDELGAESTLGRRIERLQPYADPAVVHSLASSVTAMTGVESEAAHPMLLLQKYSNEDKHRAIRIAAVRTLVQNWGEPFWPSDRRMRPVQVGDVVARTQLGVVVPVETSSAVHVQRPESSTWVAPGRELDQIHRHVANVVIPTLVTGFALTRSVPPNIDLTNNGKDPVERIQSGLWEPAHQRFAKIAVAALEAADDQPHIPPIRGRRDVATASADMME